MPFELNPGHEDVLADWANQQNAWQSLRSRRPRWRLVASPPARLRVVRQARMKLATGHYDRPETLDLAIYHMAEALDS